MLEVRGSNQADSLTRVDQEIPDWFKISLLEEEAETAFGLVPKFWLGDMAYQRDCILACCLTVLCIGTVIEEMCGSQPPRRPQ